MRNLRTKEKLVQVLRTNISLNKGCRGNNAGDGPRVAESGRQKCLSRNGFVLIGLRNRSIPNSHFAVSEVAEDVLRRKFGDDFPTVYSMILEINHERIIQFYKKSVVNKMISLTDVTHIKYVNPDELREREVYSITNFQLNPDTVPPFITGSKILTLKNGKINKYKFCRNTTNNTEFKQFSFFGSTF